MNSLDTYMTDEIYEYLNICDKIKCHKTNIEILTFAPNILYIGCKRNIIEMINYAIEKGANNWDDGLFVACRSGDRDIVEMMIKKGANECEWCEKSMADHLKK